MTNVSGGTVEISIGTTSPKNMNKKSSRTKDEAATTKGTRNITCQPLQI